MSAASRLARRTLLAGVFLAIFGAVAFSSKAILVKVLYRHGVDPDTVLALRMLLSLPFFLAVSVWMSRKPGQSALRRGDYWRIVYLGLSGYYVSSYLDFLALQYISAALERLILYLNPTLILLFSVFVFKRSVPLRQWLALAVSYGGVVLIFIHDFRLGGTNIALGGVLVLGSAILYAIYLISSGEIVQRIGAVRLAAYASCIACVASIIHFLVLRPISALDLSAQVYTISIVLAVGCTVLPMFAVMMAIARLGAPLASQIGLVGPVATIVLGVIVLNEPMGGWQIIGTLLVLGGVFMVTQGGSPKALVIKPDVAIHKEKT